MPTAFRRHLRLAALVLALTASGCRRVHPATEPIPPPPPAPDANPAPASVSTPAFSPEDVFRRAFWRRPGPENHILHAERYEPAGPGGRWRWAIAVRPSASLLATLRDPATFGLLPLPAGFTPPGYAVSLPDWFPSPRPGDELLATRGGYFTILYRPEDGILYARDHGTGMTPPADAGSPHPRATSAGPPPAATAFSAP